MSDVEAPGPSLPRLPLGFKLALPLLMLVFIVLGIHRANRSTLRGDEIVTLFEYWRGMSYGDLAVRGASAQVSPAPLLYFADKLADVSRGRLNYLGLTPPGYVRLPSLLFSAGLGLAAALAVAFMLRAREGGATPLQYFFVLCGLATFYFNMKVFSFACIERPYGLWNGLWLLLLAWLLGRPPLPHIPMLLLTLMAGTATAACFQILAIGIALVVVRRIEHRPAKEILREGALLLALPALVGVYYALRSEDAHYEGRAYGDVLPNFIRYWLLTNLHVWIAGGTMSALALLRPRLREFAIPPVALTALMIVMPLIFSLAHHRGYSMVSRQYIWTTTALPLAFFFVALSWADLRPGRYLRTVAVAATLVIVAGNVYTTFSAPQLRKDSRALALLEKDSVLMTLLRKERPASIVYVNTLEKIDVHNILLIAEWMKVRYAALPGGEEKIWVHVQDGRLEARLLDDRWPSGADGMIELYVR